jgi:hypothetical protein
MNAMTQSRQDAKTPRKVFATWRLCAFVFDFIQWLGRPSSYSGVLSLLLTILKAKAVSRTGLSAALATAVQMDSIERPGTQDEGISVVLAEGFASSRGT